MSLNWDMTEFSKERRETLWDDEHAGLTQTVIHSTMWLAMGEITEENLVEFATRWVMHEEMFGSVLIIDGESGKLKPEWLRDYVGLRTNVGYETQPVWEKRMVKQFRQDQQRWVKRQLEEAENGS